MTAYDLDTVQRTPAQVRALHLPRAGLDEWPAVLRQCTNLHLLDLSGNNLSEWPLWLGELPKLTTLYLSDNQLTNLDFNWQELSALQVIRLRNNQLRRLPDNFSVLSRLIHLDISKNPLTTCPEVIFDLKLLRSLNLEQTRLQEIPDKWALLPRLESLYLGRNKLAKLPLSLAQLPAFQQLDLHRNQLSIIPKVLLRIRFLRKLNLAHNKLSTLPPNWKKLPWLAYLDLSYNQLEELSNRFGAGTRLEQLDLSHNELTQLPDLGQLQHLRTLDLTDNELLELPPLPPKLQTLNVRRNRRLTLHQLTGAPTLQHLDAGYTAFAGPTHTWTTGEQLTSVIISRTPMAATALPTSILKWLALTELKGHANRKERRRLLHLLAQSRTHQLALADRELIWKLWHGHTDSKEALDPAWCLRCMQWSFPELWPLCRRQILQHWGVSPALERLQQQGIRWLGKNPGSPMQVNELLAQRRIPITDSGILILGKPPYTDLPKDLSNVSTIDATKLIRWLNAVSDSAPQLTANERQTIRRLLLHSNPVNQRLALQLITGRYTPACVLPELVVQWKRTVDATIRKDIRQLLETYLTPQDRVILRRRIAFPQDLSPAAFRQKMLDLTQGSQLEVTEIMEEWI